MSRLSAILLRRSSSGILTSVISSAMLSGCLYLDSGSSEDEAIDGGTSQPDGGGGQNGVEGACRGLLLDSDVEAPLTIAAGRCTQIDRSIQVRAELTIEPGAEVVFGADAGLEVTETGAIVAEGTEAAPIVLRGETAVDGSWSGLIFGGNVPSTLTHVEIWHAGGQRYSGTVGEGNVYVRSTGRLSMNHVSLIESGAYGMVVEEGARLEEMQNCAILGSIGSSMLISAANLHQLSSTNVFSGGESPNGGNEVVVDGARIDDLTGKWSALDVPYRVQGAIYLGENSDIEIEDGARFSFDDDAGLESIGQLAILGAANAPVAFYGTDSAAGSWSGVIYGGNSSGNMVRHASFTGGGGARFSGTSGEANLYIRRGARVVIEDSLFRNSLTHGVYIEDEALLNGFSRNTFEQNALAPLSIGSTLISVVTPDQVLVTPVGDPPTPFVDVRGGSITTEIIWPTLELPLRVQGAVRVGENGLLTIAPENELVFAADSSLEVAEGALVADSGEVESPIVMRGEDPIAGYWSGIAVSSRNSVNVLSHVVIDGAGGTRFGGTSGEANLYVRGTATLQLSEVLLQNSLHWGLFADDGATLQNAGDGSPIVDGPGLDAAGLSFENNAEGEARLP
jgi:hypothetical protein